jgi:hypothetical protein
MPPTRGRGKTKAAYMQVVLDGVLGGIDDQYPHRRALRNNRIVSTSVIAIPDAIEWQANNDFRIVLSEEQQPFSERPATASSCPTWTSASTSPTS